MPKKTILFLTCCTIFAIKGMEKPLSAYALAVKKITVIERTKSPPGIRSIVYIDNQTTVGTIMACLAEINQINPSTVQLCPFKRSWYTLKLKHGIGPRLIFTENIRQVIQKYRTTKFLVIYN